MQKINPFLWFNDQAEQAMEFYTSLFKNSKIGSISRYGETGPGSKGKVMTATFQLAGLEFMALNGGPEFTFSPAISFFVSCLNRQEVDALWQKLTDGGMVFMELDRYPFSERFGWIQDKFGISWQVNLAGQPQKIAPFLMFVGSQHGKAEEALKFYTSLFDNSKVIHIEHNRKGEAEPEGTVKQAVFSLAGQEFMALDSHLEHPFTFTPAISFFVSCNTQAEVDKFWEGLSEGGEIEQCGWLKDRYGVSWQIVPTLLGELLNDKDPEKSKRVMDAMLQMKKLDIEKLKLAWRSSTQ